MKRTDFDLLIPFNDLKKGFAELKANGFVFTYAESFTDLKKSSSALRLVYKAPAADLKPSEITIGPFPLEIEHYEHIKNKFCDAKDPEGMLMTYLAFRKLEYEKTGITGGEYSLRIENDNVKPLMGVMALYDIEHPFVGESFVWFSPKEKCREMARTKRGKRFGKENYTWWNIVLDLGADIVLTTIEDYKDQYYFFPAELLSSWFRFMPAHIPFLVEHLYSKYTAGCAPMSFNNLSEVLKTVEEAFKLRDIDKAKPDRELLIKELCDYNGIEYPMNAHAIVDYLLRLKIICPQHSHNSTTYTFAEQPPEPKKILKFPPEWDDRANIYVSTGSILFAYLTPDESFIE